MEIKNFIFKIGVAVLAFGLISCSNSNSKIKTIKPYRGQIQKSFTELAKTRLEKTYDFNMPLSGRLKRINLESGDKVKKNQIIAELVQYPLRQAVLRAKARVNTITAEYENQKLQLKRNKALRIRGFISQAALDESISRQKVLKAQLKESIAQLAIALYNLKESVLRSNISGVVLDRFTEGGKWLPEGTPLLQIGDLNQLQVICDVLSQQAQQLHIGDTVFFTSVGNPQILTGKIERIYSSGFTKRSSLGVEEQRVNVISRIFNPESANLGVGFRLQERFLVGLPNKKALIIPRFSVLQDSKDNFYVFKAKNKKLKKQIVQIGISTDTEVSITKGLTTNDNIVAQPTAEMHDGMEI